MHLLFTTIKVLVDVTEHMWVKDLLTVLHAVIVPPEMGFKPTASALQGECSNQSATVSHNSVHSYHTALWRSSAIFVPSFRVSPQTHKHRSWCRWIQASDFSSLTKRSCCETSLRVGLLFLCLPSLLTGTPKPCNATKHNVRVLTGLFVIRYSTVLELHASSEYSKQGSDRLTHY